MRSIRKIIWVLPHPTPYNVYLLNALGERIAIPSEALYRWAVLPNHPWSELPERKFSWRIADNPGGRDAHLERLASSDDSVLFIFAGWRDKTIFPILVRRWRRRLPYAFWSDTPKVSGGVGRWLVNAVQMFFTGRALALLATGTPAIRNYSAMGVAQAKLKNFPFVVDPGHFARALAIRSKRAHESPVTFVMPARLMDYLKGQRVAIEAVAKSRARVPDVPLRLVLAGSGPDGAMLRELARRLGVAEQVEFRGWVEYEDVPAMLGEADALVLPSRWDPFPVAVIEGMAAGLPVLGSSACGSVQERVVEGVNGFIHTAGDSDQLAENMLAIATSSSLRGEMQNNALATSRNHGIAEAARVINSLLHLIQAGGNASAE